jgi:hypothetical protein
METTQPSFTQRANYCYVSSHARRAGESISSATPFSSLFTAELLLGAATLKVYSSETGTKPTSPSLRSIRPAPHQPRTLQNELQCRRSVQPELCNSATPLRRDEVSRRATEAVSAFAGVMPALPHLYRRAASLAAAAEDTRILDSRQLQETARHAARTLSSTISAVAKRIPHLERRQNQGLVAIPYFYQYGGPSPGAVVGIVLGSVVGFLLLIWLFWSLSNGSGFIRSSNYEEEDVVVRRRSRSPRSRRSSRQTEMTSRSPRRERVIRQERIVRDIPVREPSRIRETVIVDEAPRVERRVEGDDM